MANINLHQSFQRSEEMRKKPSFFASRTFISFVILVVFSGAYFGLKLYQGSLENKKQSVLVSKRNEIASIDVEVAREVADFGKRIEEVEYNVDNKNKADENFSRLERLILSSVYLNRYEYSFQDSIISLEAVTGSYQSIAEQMLNFSKSGEFSSVDISDTRRDEEGQIVFELELVLNKETKK